MTYQTTLNEYLQPIVGKKLETINLACEMMMFSFEDYSLHTLCLTRIIQENDILVTTFDYQNWDRKVDKNNDELYFIKKYKKRIVDGTVTSVNITPLHDLQITMDNNILIELFISNGYHHFGDEKEQWIFFRQDDHHYPFITVCSKTVDIVMDW